jgi:protein SCO1/2
MTAAAPSVTGVGAEAVPTRSRRKQVAILGGLMLLALGVAILGRTFRPKPALPVYGTVPSFALTDQSGASFTNANMLGKAWVADFVFTHCTSTCPTLTARMKELETKLDAKGKGKGVRFVSFSVDPENDTPPVLTAYAAKVGADAPRWTFVTGASDDIQKTVVDGFKVAIARTDRGGGEHDILHGNWFAVGDARGNVRGYYITENDDDMAALLEDVIRLESEN